MDGVLSKAEKLFIVWLHARPRTLRVQFGSGGHALDGFINTDAKAKKGLREFHLENLELLNRDIFDEVYLSHILEHFTISNVRKLLASLYDKLKPSGKITVVVPNFENYLKNADQFLKHKDFETTVGYFFGLDRTHMFNDNHKCGFSPEFMQSLFEDAGFERIEVIDGRTFEDYHIKIDTPPDGWVEEEWRTFAITAHKQEELCE